MRSELANLLQRAQPALSSHRSSVRWIQRGGSRKVGPYQPKYGYHVKAPGAARLSFAVDPILPLGSPTRALPARVLGPQAANYRAMSADQRAGMLAGLAGDLSRVKDVNTYERFRVCSLEWRLFGDGVEAIQLGDDISDLDEQLSPPAGGLFNRFLAIWNYSLGPEAHLQMQEFILKDLAARVSPLAVQLGIADCIATSTPVWAELAYHAVKVMHSGAESVDEKQFVTRFGVFYPKGLVLKAAKQTKATYRFACPELESVSRGAFHIDVPDLTSCPELMLAVESCCTPTKAKFDPARMAALETETQALRSRLSVTLRSDEQLAERHLPTCAPAHVEPWMIEEIRQLFRDGLCTRADFSAYAKGKGMMPLGLKDRVNSWALTNLGDRLLNDEDPIVLNRQALESNNI